MKHQKASESHDRWNGIRSFLSSLTALTVGGLIGAGVALLYAPQSGRATRSIIYSKGVALKEKAAEEVHLAGSKAKDQLNHVSRDFRYKTNELGSRLHDTMEESRSTIGSVLMPFQHNGS